MSLSPRQQRWPLVRVGLGGLVALLGVVGTLAGQLAWDNAWVTAVGVAAIAAGGAIGLWDTTVVPLIDRRRQAERDVDRFRAILLAEPSPVSEADPYALGVFDSQFARDVSGRRVPPYVRRSIDDRLDAAFDEHRLNRTQRLVVVRGDPKAGKTRTLWEAVTRHVGGRQLLAIRPPLPGEERAAEHKPLETLLGLNVPTSDRVLVWIDDAHEHREFGLTANNLRRLVDKFPGVMIAATFHNSELEAIKEFDKPLEQLVRAASDGLVLSTRLGDTEVRTARAEYPSLAGDAQLAWLPEWFAAVNLLRDRYTDNRLTHQVGVAAVDAAIDWRRMGMPPTIPRGQLRGLTQTRLAELALPSSLTDDEFDAAIDWATEPVAARASLLTSVGDGAQPSYRAFDATLTWPQIADRPVGVSATIRGGSRLTTPHPRRVLVLAWPRTVWSVPMSAKPHGFVSPTATMRSKPPPRPSTAASSPTSKTNRRTQSLSTTRSSTATATTPPGIREQVAKALRNKGVTLGQLDRSDEAIVVYDQVIDGYRDDPTRHPRTSRQGARQQGLHAGPARPQRRGHRRLRPGHRRLPRRPHPRRARGRLAGAATEGQRRLMRA